MAKGVKTGGRQKGSRNKRTEEAVRLFAESGVTPLEYLLSVMTEDEDAARRLEAAKAAAPYVHPRLAAIEHTGKDGEAIQSLVRVEFVGPNT